MHRRRYVTLTSALLAGSLAGCLLEAGPTTPVDTDENAKPGTESDAEDASLAELVAGTNDLAFDLFDKLRADAPNANLMVSPVSVTTALAMTYAGARGETREQMREALGYALEDETLHETFNALQGTLDERGQDIDEDDLPSAFDEDSDPVPFQLNLVNALWGQEGFPFRDEYLSTVADHYGGGLETVDFTDDPDGVRDWVNAWVADHTEDRIDELLPTGSLDTETRLVLTNAIYFMANWRYPFEEASTEQAEFTALDGSTTDVPLMSADHTVPAATVDGAQAVELPYVGEDVSMLVVLPPEGEFESYEEMFGTGELARIVDALEEQRGYVKLPRFEFESSFQLEPTLSALGMTDAFDQNGADFSGMADLSEAGENLYLDEVYHDTYVAVDEEGTEAAAATGAVVALTSAPPTLLEADRPFLFAIRDRRTETVLFVGRVVDAGVAQG